MNILDRLFQREEMNGDGSCPTYLIRWTIGRLGDHAAVYLHHFVGSDWSRDLHDHPKRFISIGLRGRYIEYTHLGRRAYEAPWLRTFPASHAHSIFLLPGEDCWTLVIVLRKEREWGFWPTIDGVKRWIPWRVYVGSDTLREQGKACP